MSTYNLRARTLNEAIAEIQFRVVQNIRDVGRESEAFVSFQVHAATIRLEAAD